MAGKQVSTEWAPPPPRAPPPAPPRPPSLTIKCVGISAIATSHPAGAPDATCTDRRAHLQNRGVLLPW